MQLMSSDLRDPIATNQAPREALQQGTGEKTCGPGALLMLCVFSPVYAAGKAATSGVPRTRLPPIQGSSFLSFICQGSAHPQSLPNAPSTIFSR